AGLAVSDHARLAIRLEMRCGYLLDENGFGACDVFNGLSRNGIGQESDEVARMAGLNCDTDFTVGFKPADAGTVSGARINDNEGPQLWIDFDARRRDDAYKRVIHRSLQCTPVNDQLSFIIEHVRRCFRHVFAILIPTLPHDIPEQDAALECV